MLFGVGREVEITIKGQVHKAKAESSDHYLNLDLEMVTLRLNDGRRVQVNARDIKSRHVITVTAKEIY